MLKAENVSYKIGSTTILENISATFLPNQFNVILGPNGSGKSSFLKICSAEINSFSGNVFYDSINVKQASKEKLAKYRAVMSQQPELSFSLMVEEVVMMGRYPHFNFSPTKNDFAICEEVMAKMKLDSFVDRNYLTLSGGEKQRVQFARVLTQIWETPSSGNRFLFLDEPLNNLDIKYQQEFLEIAKIFSTKNTTLIAVLHDINLAIQYADKLFFFKQGFIAASGKPNDIINSYLIKDIFDIDATVITNPLDNKPLVLFNNL
jgi:iron complex transport system ATP-binding protein